MHFKLIVFCLSFGTTCQVMPSHPLTTSVNAASQAQCIHLATKVVRSQGLDPRMLSIKCIPQ